MTIASSDSSCLSALLCATAEQSVKMRRCQELVDASRSCRLCRVLLNTSEMIYVR